MVRSVVSLLVAAALAAAAPAHFVFVVPAPDGKTAAVVLSEELAPDEEVNVAKVAPIRLFARGPDGKDAPVEFKAGEHALTATLPGAGPRVVYGSVAYGVMQRGEGKPYLLAYHPKAVLGPADAKAVGDKLPAELVAVRAHGKVRFKLTAAGKPVAAAEVAVLKPDGSKAKVSTGTDGLTEAFPAAGRYGAWVKVVEAKAGEHAGKKYSEVRHYPTLVADVGGAAYPPLPAAVSSLGAVGCGGYVYVYGGHAGKTHSYDTQTVLGTFHRLKLDGGAAWEALPGGPILQGLNLAAHAGKVYRVGGMQPRNAPGEPGDNHSVADVARYDPSANRWEDLPPLPAGRSSHDVVVSGGKLVVVGGWDQRGRGQKPVWHDTALVFDPAAPAAGWKAIPQPFKRRALAAAAVGSKVYVIAGLGETGTEPRVDVLDVPTGTWAKGPDLPAERGAFAPAAGVVGGRVVVNTFDGPVFRLSAAGDSWERVGAAAHKRMVARLVASGPDAAVLVGGAGGAANVGEVETVRLGDPATAAPNK